MPFSESQLNKCNGRIADLSLLRRNRPLFPVEVTEEKTLAIEQKTLKLKINRLQYSAEWQRDNRQVLCAHYVMIV